MKVEYEMFESLRAGANGGYISRTKIEFVFYEMSLPWRLNKLARKKWGELSDTEALFGIEEHCRGRGRGGAKGRNGGGRVLHKRATAGNGNPLGTLVVEGQERRKKWQLLSARAQMQFSTRASRGEVGFKSFTHDREINSSNQQRRF